MPPITGILETCLYVDDLARSVAFFEQLGLMQAKGDGERFAAMDAGSSTFLLLFKRGASTKDSDLNGGTLPGHDGSGPQHMAFAIPLSSYDDWKSAIGTIGAKIRGEVTWPTGGRSLYFEDPDGHVLEVATPGVWPRY